MLRCLVAALAIAAGVLARLPGEVLAAGSPQVSGVTLTARAGFDGYYKEGRWAPLRVQVANDGPDLRASLEVAVTRNNNAQVIVRRDLDLPTQSRRELFLYVPMEGFTSNLKVNLVAGQTVAANTTVRLVQTGQGDLVYGVIANTPSAYNLLADLDPLAGSAFVAQLDLGDLPPVTSAWHSLDVLVLSDVDTGALTPEQRAALAGWVAAGGRLVVAGGPGWQKAAAGVAGLLPLAPSGTVTVADTSALAAFAAAATAPGPAVAATGSVMPDAVVLARAGDLPLLISRQSGFGQVVYLAFDPAFEPLRSWPGLEGLFRNLLSGGAERPGWAAGLSNWYSVRDAANALPGMGYPSALQVCGFLAVYLVAVGPANYLLLRRLKRRELAWVTIPVIVLVFSLGAYVTGQQLRGARAILHRLAVIQVWPDAEYARVEGVVGLFSPRRSDFDLAVSGPFLARPLPADSFGAPGGSFTLNQADQTVIPEVRMDIGGVEPFVVQGQIPAPRFEGSLRLEVGTGMVQLVGTVTNRSNVTLTGAVLLAPGAAVQLGDLEPGETESINQPLYNAQAIPAAVNSIQPALLSSGASGPVQPAYPSPGYDTTVDDILGSGSYYDNREQFRKYSLLTAMMQPYNGSGRGAGVYLVGWAKNSPLQAQLLNADFDTVDLSLYLISLPPQLDLGQGALSIPPGLMTWMAVNAGQSVVATPYNMYLYQGNEAVLRFTPAVLVPFSAVQSLVLHLGSAGQTGPAPLQVQLWDQQAGQWEALASVEWGDTPIESPGRFVSPTGSVQVRVVNTVQAQVYVAELDFTLTVER